MVCFKGVKGEGAQALDGAHRKVFEGSKTSPSVKSQEHFFKKFSLAGAWGQRPQGLSLSVTTKARSPRAVFKFWAALTKTSAGYSIRRQARVGQWHQLAPPTIAVARIRKRGKRSFPSLRRAADRLPKRGGPGPDGTMPLYGAREREDTGTSRAPRLIAQSAALCELGNL